MPTGSQTVWPPPLAQERAAVLDEYFTELEVQRVDKGEGWKQINALKKIWENHG